MARMPKIHATTRRTLTLLLAALSAGAASAQSEPEPAFKRWYMVGSLSRSEYTSDDGFISCRCRSDKSQALRLGGGYRFGVSAVEVWMIDFGKATFLPDAMGPSRTAHIRAAAVGVAWTARFGQSWQANWRLGAASVHTSSNELPSTRSVRPIYGAALGVRITDSLVGELSLDITNARDGARSPTQVAALGLGLRHSF